MNRLLQIFIVFLFIISANNLFAQEAVITAKFRAETIDSVLTLLKEKYSYPEIALKMEAAIRERQKRGEYDGITDGNKLAEKLAADLRAVFDDKHLRINYSAEPIPLRSGVSGEPSPEEIERARLRQSRENYGLEKVEILRGNIGFIKLNYFAPLDWSADVYSAALNTITNTDALIIDLRDNRGSMDIDTMPFFCSYLFDRPVQFGEVVFREANETRQLWTSAQVPGKKYLDKPVYLLMSRRTASGAEAFVKQLKTLKRATLIGEVTAGATMPGGTHRVNEHFSIWISTGRRSDSLAENENKGTVPDVPILPEKALNLAYLQALNQLFQNSSDDEWKAELKKVVDSIEK